MQKLALYYNATKTKFLRGLLAALWQKDQALCEREPDEWQKMYQLQVDQVVWEDKTAEFPAQTALRPHKPYLTLFPH